MSDALAQPVGGEVTGASPAGSVGGFSPRVVLALILVGVFSFSALAVLSAYAPDLRSGSDGRGHALSKSAIGFAGAVLMLKAEGVPTLISRSPRAGDATTLKILTPTFYNDADDLKEVGVQPPPAKTNTARAAGAGQPILIVLPKWEEVGHPVHRGWVRKGQAPFNNDGAARLLKAFGASTHVERRQGAARPLLHGAVQGDIPEATGFRLGAIDRLQTISGPGWTPVLLDDAGRPVLVASKDDRVFVLSDPDLLNTQGLADIDTARAGLAIVNGLRPSNGAVAFDVTLNGFKRERSLLRLMLEPPLLGATLCALAAAVLIGLHAAARFGPPLRRGRAVALGQSALVDNSAGLIRMAGKEPALAVAYAEQVQAQAAKAVGAHSAAGEGRTAQLASLGQAKRSSLDLRDLISEAARARTRAELLQSAKKLHQWRLEITRERE